MGTARICHIPLWGQRGQCKGLAKRGWQEAKERRYKSPASVDLRNEGTVGTPDTQDRITMLGKC